MMNRTKNNSNFKGNFEHKPRMSFPQKKNDTFMTNITTPQKRIMNDVLFAKAVAVANSKLAMHNLFVSLTDLFGQNLERKKLEPISPLPSISSRYKTELCRPFEESGECKYCDKCQFAHGVHELRNLQRHPKYKTELCRTFHSIGYCPYGSRCHFIHSSQEAIDHNRNLALYYSGLQEQLQQHPPRMASKSMSTESDIEQQSSFASSVLSSRITATQNITNPFVDLPIEALSPGFSGNPAFINQNLNVNQFNEMTEDARLPIFNQLSSPSDTNMAFNFDN